MQQLAGPASGLTIVDKAAAITNTLRVLQALEEVAKLLQVRRPAGGLCNGGLRGGSGRREAEVVGGSSRGGSMGACLLGLSLVLLTGTLLPSTH